VYQVSENTSTSHQVERAGRTYTGGDSHSYTQQRERVIQPADLRVMPAGHALALPQGREPIRVDLFPEPLASLTVTGPRSAAPGVAGYLATLSEHR
jgi:hypothetical protein